MIAIDIETVGNITPDSSYFHWLKAKISAPSNYSKPEAIEGYKIKAQAEMIEKAPLDARTGKVILIGMLTEVNLPDPATDSTFLRETLTPDTPLHYYGLYSKDNEVALLEDFLHVYNQLYEAGASPMVSFNGKEFDIPFIQKRLLLNNIPNHIPCDDPMGLTYPYSNKSHFDIRRYLDKGTLAEWSFLLNLSDTPASEGNKIAQMYAENRVEDIKWKNVVDVFTTYQIAKRLMRVI